MKKLMMFLALGGFSQFLSAGCLDGLTTSTTIYSKIHGFYISRALNGNEQEQIVILDKANCSAAQTGDISLASTTKSYYYLSFKESDKALYSLLLSAQAQNIELEFRLGNPFPGSSANSIAYIIFPMGARSQ